MVTRSMWQGTLSVNSKEVPVKLYAAVEDRQIHFHLLHKRDGARVRQRMVEAQTETAVPIAEARKAFQVQPGVCIALSGEELDQAAPEPSRQIKVMRFVPVGAVDAQLYERPYYLGPTEDSEDDYFGLAAALEEKRCAGIVTWVMRKHSYVGALLVHGGYLMLATLRHAGEFIHVSELSPPAGRALEPKEKKLAEQLVDALSGRFRPENYHDEYRERVRELVDAERSGKKPKAKKRAPARRPSGSLSDVLAASLKRAPRSPQPQAR